MRQAWTLRAPTDQADQSPDALDFSSINRIRSRPVLLDLLVDLYARLTHRIHSVACPT
jgi:hypothetical protein